VPENPENHTLPPVFHYPQALVVPAGKATDFVPEM